MNMKIILIRHSMTSGNMAKQYIGSTDEPLCREGKELAMSLSVPGFSERVFVSPMKRTTETAKLLFPNASFISVPGMREMDFGAFERKSAVQMENDPRYRAWTDSMCLSKCPGGEDALSFSKRVCRAFTEAVESSLASGCKRAVFVVHGGTIMAVMAKFASPSRPFYEWGAGNCGGFCGTYENGSIVRFSAFGSGNTSLLDALAD